MIITGCYFVTKKWHSLHLNCRRQVEYIYLNQVLVKLTALLKRLSNMDNAYVKGGNYDDNSLQLPVGL